MIDRLTNNAAKTNANTKAAATTLDAPAFDFAYLLSIIAVAGRKISNAKTTATQLNSGIVPVSDGEGDADELAVGESVGLVVGMGEVLGLVVGVAVACGVDVGEDVGEGAVGYWATP